MNARPLHTHTEVTDAIYLVERQPPHPLLLARNPRHKQHESEPQWRQDGLTVVNAAGDVNAATDATMARALHNAYPTWNGIGQPAKTVVLDLSQPSTLPFDAPEPAKSIYIAVTKNGQPDASPSNLRLVAGPYNTIEEAESDHRVVVRRVRELFYMEGADFWGYPIVGVSNYSKPGILFGLLCDQPQPLPPTERIRVHPAALQIGDVLTAQLRQTTNGLPYTRRYEITGPCVLANHCYTYSARWLDSGEAFTDTYDTMGGRLEWVVRVVKG